MRRLKRVSHRFVENLPKVLDEAVVYISVEFATAAHRCCCGCGNEVVTPLNPKDWALIFDGETISLDPSIGNWSFPCQSHYWIERGRVYWARVWTKEEIAENRSAHLALGERGEVSGERRDDGDDEREYPMWRRWLRRR